MRPLLAAIAVVGVFAMSASAVSVDPRKLVLRTSDIPAGFVVDRDETGVRTNAEAAASEKDRRLIRRLGRVTGYNAKWKRGHDSINVHIDLFRNTTGARQFSGLHVTAVDRSGITGFGPRTSIDLGDGGWVWRASRNGELAWVAWRSGRVFSSLATWGIAPQRALKLARAQQRRIAAGLG